MDDKDIFDYIGCWLPIVIIIIIVGVAVSNKGTKDKPTNRTPRTGLFQPIPTKNDPFSHEQIRSNPIVDEPVKKTTRSRFTPDDAYYEGYDAGYQQGKYDGSHGYGHGNSYDNSNPYYNEFEDNYLEGYENGYNEGYNSGQGDYDENEETED